MQRQALLNFLTVRNCLLITGIVFSLHTNISFAEINLISEQEYDGEIAFVETNEDGEIILVVSDLRKPLYYDSVDMKCIETIANDEHGWERSALTDAINSRYIIRIFWPPDATEFTVLVEIWDCRNDELILKEETYGTRGFISPGGDLLVLQTPTSDYNVILSQFFDSKGEKIGEYVHEDRSDYYWEVLFSDNGEFMAGASSDYRTAQRDSLTTEVVVFDKTGNLIKKDVIDNDNKSVPYQLTMENQVGFFRRRNPDWFCISHQPGVTRSYFLHTGSLSCYDWSGNRVWSDSDTGPYAMASNDGKSLLTIGGEALALVGDEEIKLFSGDNWDLNWSVDMKDIFPIHGYKRIRSVHHVSFSNEREQILLSTIIDIKDSSQTVFLMISNDGELLWYKVIDQDYRVLHALGEYISDNKFYIHYGNIVQFYEDY